MKITLIRNRIFRQLDSSRARARFDVTRSEVDALRELESPMSVVTFLHGTRLDQARERSAVTRAVIEQVQKRRDSSWGAILFAAFCPAIANIQRGLQYQWPFDAREVESLVYESFFEMAGTLPLETQGNRAVINLVLGTRRLVLRHIRRETAHRRCETPFCSSEPLPVADLAPSPETLLSNAESKVPSGPPLISTVRGLYPNATAVELQRHYARIRKQQSRLATELFSASSGHSGPSRSPL